MRKGDGTGILSLLLLLCVSKEVTRLQFTLRGRRCYLSPSLRGESSLCRPGYRVSLEACIVALVKGEQRELLCAE